MNIKFDSIFCFSNYSIKENIDSFEIYQNIDLLTKKNLNSMILGFFFFLNLFPKNKYLKLRSKNCK